MKTKLGLRRKKQQKDDERNIHRYNSKSCIPFCRSTHTLHPLTVLKLLGLN